MVSRASATSATRSPPAPSCASSTTATRRRSSAGQVDDAPYGGGAGMVMRVDVVDAALEAAYGPDRGGRADRRADARPAASSTRRWPRSWPASRQLALLCGRYEGFDERVREHLATRLGLDRPLRARRRRAGGDGRRRRGDCASSPARSATPTARSRSPSARRSKARPSIRTTPAPPTYRGWGVPEVLLSGDHERVREWRRERSRERAPS